MTRVKLLITSTPAVRRRFGEAPNKCRVRPSGGSVSAAAPRPRSKRGVNGWAWAWAMTVVGALGWAPLQAAAQATSPAAATAISAPTPQTDELPPPPAPPRPLTIDAPVESTLANGLRVIVARRPGVQLVSAQLLVLAGAETDPPGRAGLANLTASLLSKGTRRHSASEMANAIEMLGGSLDSGAGWNQSSISVTVGVPMLGAALALVREAATEPLFAEAELDRLRSQAIDGMTVEYTQPGTLALLAADRLRFGAGPYGHPPTGTPTSLPRIHRADLMALHHTAYRPDHAVLLLAGDIDAATAWALARKHFGSWRQPHTPWRHAEADGRAAATFESGLPLRTVVIDMPRSGQASVALFVPVPPRGVDRAAADVMNSVLGGGYSSRLNAEIRIKRGLSYGADSRFDARRDGGLLYASAQTRNATAAEVAVLLSAEFDRLVAEPVPADELAARKASLIGEFSRGVETTAGLNGAVASLVVAGLPTTELGQRIGELSAVSTGDVQRYAAAQLGRGARRVVIAGEAAQFAPALQAATTGGAASILSVDQGQLDFDAPGGLTRR